MAESSLALRYGVYDHTSAVVFTNTRAFIFTGHGTWEPFNMADVMMNTGVVTKAAFDKRFPNLPPLPKGAFKP